MLKFCCHKIFRMKYLHLNSNQKWWNKVFKVFFFISVTHFCLFHTYMYAAYQPNLHLFWVNDGIKVVNECFQKIFQFQNGLRHSYIWEWLLDIICLAALCVNVAKPCPRSNTQLFRQCVNKRPRAEERNRDSDVTWLLRFDWESEILYWFLTCEFSPWGSIRYCWFWYSPCPGAVVGCLMPRCHEHNTI